MHCVQKSYSGMASNKQCVYHAIIVYSSNLTTVITYKITVSHIPTLPLFHNHCPHLQVHLKQCGAKTLNSVLL